MRRAFRISWENDMQPCLHCGVPIQRKTASGQPPKYCGVGCRAAACYERSKADGRLQANTARAAAKRTAICPIYITACAHCGHLFTARRRGKKYCDQTCSMRAFSRRRVEDGRQAAMNAARKDETRARNRAARKPRTCVACGVTLSDAPHPTSPPGSSGLPGRTAANPGADSGPLGP